MEDLELIQKYIRGTCSQSELQQIEQRIETEASFKTLVEQERIVATGIGLAERDRLKQMLQKEQSHNKMYWYVAAAIIPIMIVSYFFIISDPNYQKLYEENYEIYGVYEFGQERGSSTLDSLESFAFNAYKEERFDQAISNLDKLYDRNSNDGYLLYKAISLNELNNTKEALSSLKAISSESNYNAVSQWYQALIYLKEGNVEEAKTLLQILSNQQNGLSKKAAQLLDDL